MEGGRKDAPPWMGRRDAPIFMISAWQYNSPFRHFSYFVTVAFGAGEEGCSAADGEESCVGAVWVRGGRTVRVRIRTRMSGRKGGNGGNEVGMYMVNFVEF